MRTSSDADDRLDHRQRSVIRSADNSTSRAGRGVDPEGWGRVYFDLPRKMSHFFVKKLLLDNSASLA